MDEKEMKALIDDAERWRFLERRHETISEAEQCGDSSDVWSIHYGYEPVTCVPGELRRKVDDARTKERT